MSFNIKKQFKKNMFMLIQFFSKILFYIILIYIHNIKCSKKSDTKHVNCLH